MSSTFALENEMTSGLCTSCGVPLDSQYFDVSTVDKAPDPGAELLLARFDLPAQYCGVLQYFSQFTDRFGKDCSAIQTPDLEWRILVNNHALFPYFSLRHIVNPWGYGSFPVNIRLDEASTLEFVVRGVAGSGVAVGDLVKFAGGRLVGRFWYNAAYGDVATGRA